MATESMSCGSVLRERHMLSYFPEPVSAPRAAETDPVLRNGVSKRASLPARVAAAIEPWYDWGRRDVHRLDHQCEDFADESYGPVRFFAAQWLGFHFSFDFGRTPLKISDDEVAAYRARHQADAEARS